MAQSDGISTTTHFTVMIQFYYFPNTTQVLFWSGGGGGVHSECYTVSGAPLCNLYRQQRHFVQYFSFTLSIIKWLIATR